MLKTYRSISLIAALALIVGCSTTGPKSLDKVQGGMDKDEVLRAVGNPKQTYRRDGKDHWVYNFFEDEQEIIRTVSFANGQVVKVGPARPRISLEQELESSDTIEEFEQKVRSRKRRP